MGTCMGMWVSPSYASLFMGSLEKKLLENCPAFLKQFIYLWKRFIDYILLIRLGSWEEFCEFFNYLNSFHTTIEFDKPCYNKDENSCNFLNLKISIDHGVIHTDLYRKPTDKPRALLPSRPPLIQITSQQILCTVWLSACSACVILKKCLKED